MKFSEIKFGLTSAEAEATDFPELLINSFYDATGKTNRILNDSDFLILGEKGTGKSAIAQHIKLKSESDPLLFVKDLTLSDFPYHYFNKISVGSNSAEEKYPETWRYLLLIQILESLLKDNSFSSDFHNFQKCINILEELGVLQADNIKNLVRNSSKKTFKGSVPKFIEVGSESTYSRNEPTFIQVQNIIWQIISHSRFDSKHFIIIDGLDDILTANNIQYKALSALITEASSINRDLKKLGIKSKIIILIRPDLFKKLPAPNKNKVSEDYSLRINWYSDTRNPEDSELISLINLRAKNSIGREINILEEYFPQNIGKKKTLNFLLELTRHRPRDLIRLLTYIQKFEKADEKKLSEFTVQSGARAYAQEYFYQEINDELVGFMDDSLKEDIFRVLSSLRKRQFKFEDIEEVAQDFDLDRKSLRQALEALYECSAIGTIHSHNGVDQYTFKYRNPNSSIAWNQRFMLHSGIYKSF